MNNNRKFNNLIPPLHNEQDFDVEKCLGDDNYYHDYLEFFKKELENEKYQGKIEDLIEDYLFNQRLSWSYICWCLSSIYSSWICLRISIEINGN